MNKSKLLKILLPLLFLAAVLLGLLQRGENRYTINNSQNKVELSDAAEAELWDFYQKSQKISGQEPKQKSTVTFLAVGDIMLSRNVADTIKKTNDPLLPFRLMDDVFESVDFSFGNLESPFSGKDTFNPMGSMVFNAPRGNIKGLVENKFKILNLANNHALDQSVNGLEYTLRYLDENNIKHIGAGMTPTDAWQPGIIDANGIKIGFVGASYASVNDNGKTTNDYVARIEDLENLKSAILNLKSNSDFIVVTMHAGTEYTRIPNDSQIEFAQAAINYGADIVIGAHPHWIQKIQKYCKGSGPSPSEWHSGKRFTDEDSKNCSNPKYIFYSLGNFIFDQMWSQETKEGLTLKIQVSKNQEPKLQGPKSPAQLDSIELIPVIIENYSTPRPATEEETKTILEKIGETKKIIKP